MSSIWYTLVMMNDKTYIYMLTDPVMWGIPRYVGSSYYPKSRLEAHLKEIRFRKTWAWHRLTLKQRWLKDLKRQGLKPGLVVLEQCPNDLRGEREDYWMELFRQVGYILANAKKAGKKSY